MQTQRGKYRWVLACLAAAVLAAPAGVVRAQEAPVSSEQVKAAIQKGIAHLRQEQNADGNWSGGGHRGGMTALNLLALINSGVSPNDPTVSKGLEALLNVKDERTYVVSLKAQVLAAALEGVDEARRETLRKALDAASLWLVKEQLPNGMWGYGGGRGRGDNSNTQFALLGLHEAAKAGAKVPPRVWVRSRQHWQNTQTTDGGWDYTGSRRAYGSMSVAGLASLYIVGQRLHMATDKRFVNGVYPNCGQYQENRAIAAGIQWITDNFSVKENPKRGNAWHLYYLYGLERVGMVSGRRHFGNADWYRLGAALLVGQQRPDGSWQGRRDAGTAFALLFLAKGNRPVLIQKVRWLGKWNRNIHDLESLTHWIDDKLGKRTTWQTTSLDVPLEDLRQSPILLIAGHEFPAFTPEQEQKLKNYVRNGGTLYFEACCGEEKFAKGYHALARKLWPEYLSKRLQKDHPVFRSYYKMEDNPTFTTYFRSPEKDTYDFYGINVGCRTSVFFSPHALDVLWELQDIPNFSEMAFQVGTNLAAYATGRELLPDKLDKVELSAEDQDGKPVEVPRGAVRIARLRHNGDYNADPHALPNLCKELRDKAKVNVVSRERHLDPSDEKIFEYPVLFMTGHYRFQIGQVEKNRQKAIENLRLYLQRGGCLVADACCGEKAFDESFREMVKELFPNRPLEPLPADHPIYTGTIGMNLGEVRYRKILSDELTSRGTKQPPLEGVTIDGKTVILYSKYDWSCALEGDNPFSCRGYVDEDGKNLAMNILLYAISY